MQKKKKIGIIFILAGICIPILSLLFSSAYLPKAGLIWNIKHSEIIIRDQNGLIDDEALFYSSNSSIGRSIYIGMEYLKKARIALPCRYLFAIGILLSATGLGLVLTVSSSALDSRKKLK